MDWTIEFTKKSLKQFNSLDKVTQKKIDKFISKLINSDNPRRFGEALKGDLYLFWRYKVGDYRLICTIEDNVLLVKVIKVAHRKEVYKNHS